MLQTMLPWLTMVSSGSPLCSDHDQPCSPWSQFQACSSMVDHDQQWTPMIFYLDLWNSGALGGDTRGALHSNFP